MAYISTKWITLDNLGQLSEQNSKIGAKMTDSKGKNVEFHPKFRELGFLKHTQGDHKEVGERVVLTSKRHGVAQNNPFFWSDHACYGTVTDSGITNIIVRWDNTYENSYAHRDVALAKDSKTSVDPNRAFLRKKRRPNFERWT